MDKKHGIIEASMAAAAGSFWCCCVANVAGQLKPGFAVAKKRRGEPFHCTTEGVRRKINLGEKYRSGRGD